MDIVSITTVAQIVQRLLAHMREDVHTTRRLHCLVHSMPNVLQTLLLFFMIFNCLNTYHSTNLYKDGKFKVCSWLCLPITVET